MRRVRLAAAVAVATSLLGATVVAPPAGAAPGDPPAPTPTPARVGPVGSLAVLGDSISQGTGSDGPDAPPGGIGSPRLEASWATGKQPGLNSIYQRLTAARGGTPPLRFNLSANGANMRNDFLAQAQSVPAGTGLVLVQMGGNDLCRSSEAAMTSEADYRAQFRAGLEWLRVNRPETLVMVYSVPDIYALWYVRGAAHQGETFFLQPPAQGPRAARDSTENGNKNLARLLWDTLGVIPCQSLLNNPSVPRNAGPTPDPNHPDEQRRLRVRARNIAFNTILAQECAAVLRCRFDNNTVFNFVSNRDANGVLLANKSQWRFRDTDISTQDHFHPSFPGQVKLAEQAWRSGYDVTDTAAPNVGVSVNPVAPGSGWHTSVPVSVTFTATDEAGVRGLEYRIHRPGVPAGAWTPHLGSSVTVPVSAEGISWVEARALDVNGNLLASVIRTVRIDTVDPVAVITSADGSDLTVGDEVAAAYSCLDPVPGSGLDACTGTVPNGELIDTTFGTKTFAVTATDVAGRSASATVNYAVRDVLAPAITVTVPVEGASYSRGGTVLVSYSCTDEPGGSGVVGCAGPAANGATIDTSTLGPKTFTVTATDAAGNVATRSVTYQVIDTTPPEHHAHQPAGRHLRAR